MDRVHDHEVRKPGHQVAERAANVDRKSTRLNSSHLGISYAVFCFKKKNYGWTSVFLSPSTRPPPLRGQLRALHPSVGTAFFTLTRITSRPSSSLLCTGCPPSCREL